MLLPFCREGEVECGVDEAGRGALAGPVVAAAVVWDAGVDDPLVNEIKDSKKLSAAKRRVLAEFIKSRAVAWAVAFVDHETIDEINILQSTYRAMHDAIGEVAQKCSLQHILIDGNRFKPYGDVEHTCVVKGDDTYISIAAASILAKVARDDFMTQCAKEAGMEVYMWEKNMGYGTSAHMTAIKTHGMSTYHRRTFIHHV